MSRLDLLLVNPPSPDGGIWIRSQHRVGRRSREGRIWPQVSLAQMAALLDQSVELDIIDAVAERMSWEEFEARLARMRPRIYLTQVTAPTLENDLHGVRAAKALGAWTIAFGTHVTPQTVDTMERCPQLDFVLRGEPELTLIELVDSLTEGPAPGSATARWEQLLRKSDSNWLPMGDRPAQPDDTNLAAIKGLAWRRDDEIFINEDRPYIVDLDDLPVPRHDLLPLDAYRMPMIKGPYSFVVTSRGCPANCLFCIKHLTYGRTLRLRSPEHIVEELKLLRDLGLRHVHMYADLFTVDREHVLGLCDLMLQERLDFRWTCNSRVDFVDQEMLQQMARAGCWMISWGIESGSPEILRNVRKGYKPHKAGQALQWARRAGIKNWGYFIIGLPGETEESIRRTIEYSKGLPLDIALFHIAAPYPGTPFFFDVVEKGWFRPGTKWEEVDMDQSTVLDYPSLPAERLEYWQRRATLVWSLRPGPILTFLKGLNTWYGFKSALSVGWQTLRFVAT